MIHSRPETRSIPLDLILSLLTCSLWTLVVLRGQTRTLNYLLKREKYSFWKIYLLSALTLGIYFVVYQYRKACDLAELTGRGGEADPIIAVLVSVMGLPLISDAISQSKINDLLEKEKALLPG